MAELIGTAEIRVDMPTTGARTSLRRFTNDANRRLKAMAKELTSVATGLVSVEGAAKNAGTALRTAGDRAAQAGLKLTVLGNRAGTAEAGLQGLKDAADNAATAIRDVRAAASPDIKVKVTLDDDTAAGAASASATLAGLQAAAAAIRVDLDDQTAVDAAAITARVDALGVLAPRIAVALDDQVTAGAAAITTALAALQSATATVRVDLDDQTAAGAAAITAAVDALKALSAEIKVTVDDQTAAGAATVRTAVADLQALGPVTIDVTFDDQSAQVTSTRTALTALRQAATSVANSLRSVATRATTAAAALELLRDAARDAARALHDVNGRAVAATSNLTALRAAAVTAGNSLRTMGTRAGQADGRLSTLSDRVRAMRGDMDDLGGAIDGVTGSLGDLRGSLPGLSGLLRGAGQAAGGDSGKSGLAGALAGIAAAAGLAAAAVGTALPVVAGITAALAEVAPAAGVAATGLITAVTAGAALKIGLQGVDEALKVAFDPEKAAEFDKAMRNLAPNARSFVEAIRSGAPAFKELRLDVQNRLFRGLGKELTATGKELLPTVRTRLVEAAGSLSDMGRGVLSTARQLGKSGALDTALQSATRGLRDMRELPSTIVQGLVQIGAAAAPSFNRLTGAARGGIERLSDRISQAFESGRMETAISRATDLARDLGSALGNVGSTIRNVLGAADASGSGLIGNLKSITGELERLSATAGVQSGLRELFATMGTVGRTAASVLGEALKGVAPVVTALGPAARDLARNLGAGLTTVIRSLSPILVTAAENFGRIVSAVAPLAPVVGGLVSAGLDALAPLLGAVGEQAALLVEGLSAHLGPTLQALPGLAAPFLQVIGRGAALFVELQNKILSAAMPSLQRLGSAFGRVVSAVGPLARIMADFVSFGISGFAAAAGPAIRVAGRLAEILSGALASGLEKVAAFASGHKLGLMTIFGEAKVAVTGFAIAAGQNLPVVYRLFQGLATIVLDSIGVIVNGAADAFGWIPGIGPKIRDAAKGFNLFSDLAKKGMDKAGREVNEFAAETVPKLKQNQLELRIDNWESQIKEAKRQLSDDNLPSKKRAKLEADIKAWRKNIDLAKEQIGGVKGKGVKLTVTSNAKGIAGSAQGAIKSVKDGKPKITASTNAPGVARSARGALGTVKDRRPRISVSTNAPAVAGATARALSRIPDENVYVRVSRIGLGEVARPLARGGLVGGYARGGPIRGFPDGGLIRGRGTETSDSNLIAASRNEYVVNARSTRKHLALIEAINEDRLGSVAMAAGGMVGGLARTGADLAGGLVSGMGAAMRQVQAAARALAAAAVDAAEGELQISSPSRRFATIGKQVGAGFIKGLTGTKSQIDRTADRVAASITRAFRGTGSRRDDRLVAMIQRSNKRLQSLAGQRDAIAKKLADARKFAGDLTAQAKGSGSLASLVGDQYFAPRLIAADMQKAINNVKAFGKAITTLKGKGLNKDLLRQILQMGPEQGLAFAKSLAGQDKATITRFNKLNTTLAKESTKLGRLGADTLFDSGKKASQGFLAGLKAQQKSIEKLMVSIAKAMQKSIRRALGIRSPSTVMAEVGRQSGRGLVRGLVAQIPHVDQAMSQVAGVIANGVASPAAPGLSAGGPRNRMAPAGAGAQVLHVDKLVIDNRGIIASQAEMDQWLASSLSRLAQQRRLPAGVGGRAA